MFCGFITAQVTTSFLEVRGAEKVETIAPVAAEWILTEAPVNEKK
jgi:hypothetical protein